jgi:hypothetical protein
VLLLLLLLLLLLVIFSQQAFAQKGMGKQTRPEFNPRTSKTWTSSSFLSHNPPTSIIQKKQVITFA